MTPEEKFNLITRDLQEIVDEDKIKEILKTRDLKLYIGTAPTGKPHVGYLAWVLKLADFLKAGCEVTILVADIHAYLDNMKSTLEELEYRTKFYQLLIVEMLKVAKVPIEKLKFVKGSDYQFNKDYTFDVYKLAAIASERDCKKAGAEVVKQVESPKLAGLTYPILQALDEQYLNVDAQFGGLDQRKIFMFAREFLPKIGYEKRIHLMNPLIPGLGESGKMSSSEPNSKIDFDDTDKIIKQKINKAFSIDGTIEGNGLLAIMKFIVFRILEAEARTFVIDRPEQYGGRIEYNSYKNVEDDFASKTLSSIDLKQGVAEEIIKIVTPIRDVLNQNTELIQKAYATKK